MAISMTRTWTPAEVRSLGVRTDLVTACQIAYGAGRTKAYELFRRGELTSRPYASATASSFPSPPCAASSASNWSRTSSSPAA